MRLDELFTSTIMEDQRLTFHTTSRGFHHGQADLTLIAYEGREEVGHVDFSVFENQPHVQMIEVPVEHRKRGIATALMRRLQADYPDVEIELGSLTDDGAKFFDRLPTREVPDGDFPERFARLEAVKAKLADYSARNKADPTFAPEDWNDLHDEEWRLESELRGKKPMKRIVEAKDFTYENLNDDQVPIYRDPSRAEFQGMFRRCRYGEYLRGLLLPSGSLVFWDGGMATHFEIARQYGHGMADVFGLEIDRIGEAKFLVNDLLHRGVDVEEVLGRISSNPSMSGWKVTSTPWRNKR